jgi:NDP-sugar pyrophosphorylase family protein
VEQFGYGFIPPEYLPAGKDEYWLRNRQMSPAVCAEGREWRKLEPRELEILIKNNNSCSNWDNFLVRDPFDASLIRNSYFYGLVRIGALQKVMLQYHDFCVPAGIRNSTVISSDIGDDTAIQDCSYISHYIIGDSCILSRIDEMQSTNHAKFGCGVVKDGEDEGVRIWIDVMNEAGGRSVLPFPEMLPADAFLWAAYRDDKELAATLESITQKEYGGYRGTYGVIGSHAVIKSSHIIKDVCVGEWAYIKGANKLKNISVLSSQDEPTQIGEGAEMVNGIVGYGCNAFYGIKAVRFVMGRSSSLKYGARLIHSVLGDNSTVSCCEILNNLIFPFHEQHHNNSFLIASLVQGMSNMAAGATIGSNHNSRANDGEIRAGRGFWPGLATTIKHSSYFASFILIVKGDYPYELNITLPFSLINNNVQMNRLEIMPAYFWMYNLYALERNSWKTLARDKRKIKKQRIELDYLAPDTAEEIIAAIAQIETWIKDAGIPAKEITGNAEETVVPDILGGGKEDPEYELRIEGDAIVAKGLERNNRPTMILKPLKALAAYREMLLYYALKTLADYLVGKPELSYTAFIDEMKSERQRTDEWVNLGGQIVPSFRLDGLRRQIRQGEVDSWEKIHASYDEMAEAYTLDKLRHAWEVYRYLERHPSGNTGHPLENPEIFKQELETLIAIRRMIAEQVYISRVKDFDNSFREITFRNREEMEQVAGNAENNSFVKLIRERTKNGEVSVKKLCGRL